MLYGSLVKRLRRRPLTAETAVRFRYELLSNPVNITFTGFLLGLAWVSKSIKYISEFIGNIFLNTCCSYIMTHSLR